MLGICHEPSRTLTFAFAASSEVEMSELRREVVVKPKYANQVSDNVTYADCKKA